MALSVPSGSDDLLRHFGRDGLRRFRQVALMGASLPSEALGALGGVGVPVAVPPYFLASAADDPLTLGAFAARSAASQPPAPMEAWPRIGSDGLAQLCVRPDGAVQTVLLSPAGDDMFVSTDVPSFSASLLALDRALPALATASGLAEAAGIYRELAAELRHIDGAAFAEREAWWPRVLDDVRHTLNFPFSAAFEYTDAAGVRQVATESTGPGRPHPEELLWRRLAEEGVDPGQVRRVHCELEPCLMPGHYCGVWMQDLFPQAEFTHSFSYGTTADSREAGLKGLITHAAEQAGGH
ncbi:nucleic acid/nucleotide deaminase domain-containing protein [Streptomyces cyaneofuscatus]|uniref:nucleic acid/nucleotide deaminase domain-containing protein n=1 Tax=Streptomyces cyaneofuscatus TaxID=66883 RepID=UPI00345DA3F2